MRRSLTLAWPTALTHAERHHISVRVEPTVALRSFSPLQGCAPCSLLWCSCERRLTYSARTMSTGGSSAMATVSERAWWSWAEARAAARSTLRPSSTRTCSPPTSPPSSVLPRRLQGRVCVCRCASVRVRWCVATHFLTRVFGVPTAFNEAQIGPNDIDFFGLYDCFPICFIRAIEAVGLAKKGATTSHSFFAQRTPALETRPSHPRVWRGRTQARVVRGSNRSTTSS